MKITPPKHRVRSLDSRHSKAQLIYKLFYSVVSKSSNKPFKINL